MSWLRLPLLLALAAVMFGATPAGAAVDPACGPRDDGATVCVTTLALSPDTVSSATGGTVTVTLTLSGPEPAATWVNMPYEVPGGQGVLPVSFTAVAGQPNTFSAQLQVPPMTAVGTYPPEYIWGGTEGSSGHSFRIEGLAGSDTPGTLNITGPEDTTAPELTSVAISTPNVDTTEGQQTVTVEVRATDDWAGGHDVRVHATYEPAPASHPAAYPRRGYQANADLGLREGTTRDGVWRGQLYIPPGTWGTWRFEIQLRDAWWNERTVSPEELAQAGLPSQFTSTTAGPPAAPTLSGRTESTIVCCYRVRIDGVVTWPRPASGPLDNTAVVNSASPECGTQPDRVPLNRRIDFHNRIHTAPCTVTLQVVNTAGAAPPVTVTFW